MVSRKPRLPFGATLVSMNTMLWAAQIGLVVAFAPAAIVRAARYEFAKQRMAWVGAVPRPLLVFISAAELAGAAGLVLPAITNAVPPPVVYAALGLALIQVLAFGFHLRRGEPRNARANALLAVLLIGVAAGRAFIAPL